jgi:hypothetical protein
MVAVVNHIGRAGETLDRRPTTIVGWRRLALARPGAHVVNAKCEYRQTGKAMHNDDTVLEQQH